MGVYQNINQEHKINFERKRNASRKKYHQGWGDYGKNCTCKKKNDSGKHGVFWEITMFEVLNISTLPQLLIS